MNNDIYIDNIPIGSNNPPYVICELSANHNKDFNRAMKLIEEAKATGANAIKIQSYKPDTITIDCEKPEFLIKDGLWSGRSLYNLYSEAHTPWEWHKPMFELAKKLGITIFSSPFDTTAVDFLEDLNAPAYKIASFEAIDLPLISYVAATKKPMIISTGLANLLEIEEAIDTARNNGCKQIAILHCVSGYPAHIDDYNLHNIPDMIKRFNIPVGLSDHTLSNVTATVSIGLGASIIEKHFTLNSKGGGPDDTFSLEPQKFKSLCNDVSDAWKAMGEVDYGLKSSEKDNIAYRRSIYVIKDIQRGDILSNKNIASIRPGYGLAPKNLNKVLNKKVNRFLEKGTALDWKYLE